jgi:hypothetical protein
MELVSYTQETITRVAQLVESLRYKPEGHGLDSRWLHSGRGVDSVSNRNVYQVSSVGVKAAGA